MSGGRFRSRLSEIREVEEEDSDYKEGAWSNASTGYSAFSSEGEYQQVMRNLDPDSSLTIDGQVVINGQDGDGDDERNGELDAIFTSLSAEEVGTLVLLLHQLWKLLQQYRPFVDDAEWVRLEEDLWDLVSYDLSPFQRLLTVRRMQQSFGFLQPASPGHALTTLLPWMEA